MRCPKCNEGEIKQIKVNQNKTELFSCSYCSRTWLPDETIFEDSGRNLEAFTKEHDREDTQM